MSSISYLSHSKHFLQKACQEGRKLYIEVADASVLDKTPLNLPTDLFRPHVNNKYFSNFANVSEDRLEKLFY